MSSDIAVMSLSLTFKVSRTQLANYASGTSPEGSLKVLTSGTYRGPSEDSQGTNTKTDELMKKLFSKSNSSCITHVILFSTRKKNIQKLYVTSGTSTGLLWDPIAGRPEDQVTRSSRDVRETLVKHGF